MPGADQKAIHKALEQVMMNTDHQATATVAPAPSKRQLRYDRHRPHPGVRRPDLRFANAAIARQLVSIRSP
jgi:hypothetical protein